VRREIPVSISFGLGFSKQFAPDLRTRCELFWTARATLSSKNFFSKQKYHSKRFLVYKEFELFIAENVASETVRVKDFLG
jgi:hypothetical protein